MRAWFENLQPRERLIVLAGGVVVAIIIVWASLLRPLRDQSVELREAVAVKQRLLINVQRAEGIEPADPASLAGPSSPTLVVLVDTTRQPHGLNFDRTRPDGPDGINVSFQNASFDALLNWLISMQADHGVVVESASFSSAREQGLVNGQVFLRRL